MRDAGDARFLTYDEVDTIVAGGTMADGPARVERRRAQAEEAEHHRLPDNWVGEPVGERLGDFDAGANVLTGLGVSVGDGPVRGTARIIPSAEAGFARDIEVGDVLVAPFTDAPVDAAVRHRRRRRRRRPAACCHTPRPSRASSASPRW